MEVALENIRQAEGMVEAIMPLKEKLEKRLNLSRQVEGERDRKSTRLISSHVSISYAVFCLKKKKK